MLKQLGKGLILAGLASFAAAVAWWYLFYAQLLKEDVKQASACFYQTTTDCAIGNAVIAALGDIPAYSPDLLWLAAGLVGLGIMVLGVTPGTSGK